jgi:hypothetical protein
MFILLVVEIVTPIIAMHESFGGNTNQGATYGAKRGRNRTSREADDPAGDRAGRRGSAGRGVSFVFGLTRDAVPDVVHVRGQLHDACRHGGCICRPP